MEQTPLQKLESLAVTAPEPLFSTRPPVTLLPANSPSTVYRIIDIFKKRQLGQISEWEDSPWIKFKLSPKELDHLNLQLRADGDLWAFAKHKIRWDLSHGSGEVIIRMPTSLHEIFIDIVRDEIKSQLRGLATSKPPLAQFIDKIISTGSTDIHFIADGTTLKDTRSPDASFTYQHRSFPSVILEVSYSQKTNDLNRLAQDYVIGSSGNTQLVVGLDIEYRGTKAATVSLWGPVRARDDKGYYLETEEFFQKPFRNEDGTSTEGSLTIPLSKFSPLLPANEVISISFAKLAGILDLAESYYEGFTSGNTIQDYPLPEVYEKRLREFSLPEELSQKREDEFAELEKKDAASGSDSSYVDEGDEEEDD